MIKEKLENLGKLIPVGGLILILLSSVKLSLYYKQFNIDITKYLNISEYPTLFINDILVNSAIFALLLFYFYSPFMNEKFEVNNYSRFKLYRILAASFVILAVIIIILLFLNEEKTSQFLIKFRLILLPLVIALHLLISFSNTQFKFSLKSMLIILILLIVVIDAYQDSFAIKENEDYLKYTIKLEEDNEIITDSNLQYLGKSSEFTFFYYIESKRSLIIPNSRIKEVIINNKVINDKKDSKLIKDSTN